MGLVNTVVPLADLEVETVSWCRTMLEHSPLALRMVKASMNAADDGLAGIQQLAGDATLLYYMSDEAQEGKNAYLERRRPEFEQISQTAVTTTAEWIQGARPRTLGAAVVPVVVATALASIDRPTIWWRAAAALGVALALQIGVNYANDYSDGVRGTDTNRRGPMRLTATGVATPARGAHRGGDRLLGGGRRRPRALARGRSAAPAGRRRVDRGGRALHRWAPSVRIFGSRRGGGAVLLRYRRDPRVGLRAARARARARVARGVRGRPPRGRDPARQQPPRHRDRPGLGQAHARGAPRRASYPPAVRGRARRRVGLHDRARPRHTRGRCSDCSPRRSCWFRSRSSAIVPTRRRWCGRWSRRPGSSSCSERCWRSVSRSRGDVNGRTDVSARATRR